MTTTEERIAAALSARAGGITMDTSTMEKRFAEVRERGAQERRRRRGVVAGAGALAAAAAAAAVLALVGGPWGGQDKALPGPAEDTPQEAPQVAEAVWPAGAGDPAPGRYVVDGFADFALTLPEKGDVPGSWHYELGESLWISLDNSIVTGHANVGLNRLEQVYRPGGTLPFAKDAPLVAAPTDVDGWVAWLEATGAVQVSERTQVEVDGAQATRLTLEVSPDIAPAGAFPCAPGESCLALAPDGPSLVGASGEGPVTSEMTLIPVGDELLVSVALGRTDSADQWLPLMRSIVESLDFR